MLTVVLLAIDQSPLLHYWVALKKTRNALPLSCVCKTADQCSFGQLLSKAIFLNVIK